MLIYLPYVTLVSLCDQSSTRTRLNGADRLFPVRSFVAFNTNRSFARRNSNVCNVRLLFVRPNERSLRFICYDRTNVRSFVSNTVCDLHAESL